MINSLLYYSIGYTNYSIQNTNNIYNAIIGILYQSTDDQKKEFINIMKINIGNTFVSDLRLYIFNKLPESSLLTFF